MSPVFSDNSHLLYVELRRQNAQPRTMFQSDGHFWATASCWLHKNQSWVGGLVARLSQRWRVSASATPFCGANMNEYRWLRLPSREKTLSIAEAVCCAAILAFGMASIGGIWFLDEMPIYRWARPSSLVVYRNFLTLTILAVTVGGFLASVIAIQRSRGVERIKLSTLPVSAQIALALSLLVGLGLVFAPGPIATGVALAFHALLFRSILGEIGPLCHSVTGMRDRLEQADDLARANRQVLDNQSKLRMSVEAHLRQCVSLEQQLDKVTDSEHLLKATLESITEGIIVVDNDGTLLYTNHAANELLGFPDWRSPSGSWVEAHVVNPDQESKSRQRYRWPLVRAVQGEFVEKERIVVTNPITSEDVNLTVNAGPLTTDSGDQLGAVAVLGDNSRLSRAEEEKKRAHRLYQYHKWALDQFAIVIEMDAAGKITYANDRFCSLSKYSREELIGECYTLAASDVHGSSFHDDIWQSILEGNVWQGEMKCQAKDGDEYWVDATIVPYLNRDGRPEKFLSIRTLIDERKKAEEERERLSNELAESSRQAGMAEVATGVLHNVGNVLNSVNVSANILSEQVRSSRLDSLVKAAEIISTTDSLADFFADDPRAKTFPKFLTAASDALVRDRKQMLDELSALTGNIAHVKEIVGMQQSLAKAGGLIQKVSIVETVDDAVKIVESTAASLVAEVSRVYQFDAVMHLDKHKVLQILINLITNAKQAVESMSLADRSVEIRIEADANEVVQITIEDNGIGIESESLCRLFHHGFTTKKDGHGFGLHSSAIAAKQLGGALHAFSDGPGCGASFVLELPLESAEITNDETLALTRR